MTERRSRRHPAATTPRTDRRLGGSGDPYREKRKFPDDTVCLRCGAIFRAGRWIWGNAPPDARRVRCPACRRIDDDFPAGLVTLEGDFVDEHREEICNLARNLEAREKRDHALKRIMHLRDRPEGGLEIATTDARLAHGIGEALHRAYEGELESTYVESGSLLRVSWRRV